MKLVKRPPRIKVITDAISADIRNGVCPPNTKLPSLRKLAEEWRISKSSAVEVYERLVGLELIEVRGHHGFFVKLRRSDTDSDGKRGNLQIPTTPAARGRYPTTGFHPSGSWLGSHVLPLDALRFALRETARAKTPELLSYGDPRGYMPLRMLLAERLVALGIKAQSDSILITDSASMAIDMICRLLLSPGDTVLVDDPTSLDFASLSNLHSVKVVGVPFNGQCRDLDALRRIIATHNPKLYLLSPFLHNPTGTTMPPSQVFEILSILRTAGQGSELGLTDFRDCGLADSMGARLIRSTHHDYCRR